MIVIKTGRQKTQNPDVILIPAIYIQSSCLETKGKEFTNITTTASASSISASAFGTLWFSCSSLPGELGGRTGAQGFSVRNLSGSKRRAAPPVQVTEATVEKKHPHFNREGDWIREAGLPHSRRQCRSTWKIQNKLKNRGRIKIGISTGAYF